MQTECNINVFSLVLKPKLVIKSLQQYFWSNFEAHEELMCDIL